MKVHEVMDKNPITMLPNTQVQEIAGMLIEHRITCIPVVDENNALQGIVSEGDLLYKKARPNAPHYVNLLGASIFYGGLSAYNANFKKILALEAKDLMTKDVIVAYEEEDVEDVATVMLERHLKMVPVVKEDKVVGVLSRSDIMKLISAGE